jgi:hypothetical protein
MVPAPVPVFCSLIGSYLGLYLFRGPAGILFPAMGNVVPILLVEQWAMSFPFFLQNVQRTPAAPFALLPEFLFLL